MVQGRKIIQNDFQIITELRQLKSSQARVYLSFRCLFLPNLSLSKTFTFPRSAGMPSIRIWRPFLIRIIAEDNANTEDAVTYRCNTQVLKQFQSRNPVFFFCLTIHLLMKRLGPIRTSRQIHICLRTI